MDVRTKLVTAFAIAALVIALGGLVSNAQESFRKPANAETPIVSTRGHFDPVSGDLRDGYSETEYEASSDVPGIYTPRCPNDTTIFVHGFHVGNSTEESRKLASNVFNKADQELRGQVVGFSWDSNTSSSLVDDIILLPDFGFNEAKEIAWRNGSKLARFIMDYNRTCRGSSIHLVGHSIGARAVLSSIWMLDKWNGPKIATAQLLGAAVNNTAISELRLRLNGSTDSLDMQRSIESQVRKLVNFYNREDNKLSIWFSLGTGDDKALGTTGAATVNLPSVYEDVNVTPDFEDEDGHAASKYLDAAKDRINRNISGRQPQSDGVAQFDTNNNGFIDDTEFIVALDRWVAGEISDQMYFNVLDAWVNQTRVGGQEADEESIGAIDLSSGGTSITFTATVQAVASMNVKVFQLSGQKVFEQSTTDRTLTWNRTTSKGQSIANGVYLAKVTVKGPEGQIQHHIKKFMVMR